MKNKGFTLIELLAVIVILAIILAIAVPSIANMINSSTKSAFESDAKLVLTTVDYKKMEDEAFNETNLTEDNIKSLLGLSSDNYESVNVIKEDGTTIISIVGKNKWAGLIACGTSKNMKIVASLSDCSNDVIQPVITLNGNATVSINQDEIYTDLGATALDNKDGNVTSKIIVTSNINPSIPGIYTVIYAVTDMAGNKGTATRTVNVIDNVSPTISFSTNGNSTYAKTRSTTINVIDVGGIDILKYLWNTSTTTPIESSFTNNFINGDIINSPSGVTGSYYLWILGKDKAGNTKISRSNVFNLDNTIPVITVTGTNPITINKGSIYTDQGATVTDNIDVTVTVASTGSVNPNVVGTYTITYNATDSSGNIAVSKTRTINVVDALAPVITILGSNPITLYIGETYTDAGATALDDVDGNVTSKITTTSNVNPNVMGTYNVTYTVKDNANNAAVATRTVNVLTNIFTYSYTGNYQTFTVPKTGNYQVELWGAQGSGMGGFGGYTKGTIALNQGTILYVYIGKSGSPGLYGVNETATPGYGAAATFNGGGAGGNANGGAYPYASYTGGFSGGGATDIRLISGYWDDTLGLRSRIMVAGGGGGTNPNDVNYDNDKSNAGGLNGQKGGLYVFIGQSIYVSDVTKRGNGGTQTTGNAFGIGGRGDNSGIVGYCNGHSGGGGGYYGGNGGLNTGGNCHIIGGGGGSSFISGYTGCNAVNSSGIHTGSANHYSGYTFTNASMIAGNAVMPNPLGGTETGHNGNGYAKIILIP